MVMTGQPQEFLHLAFSCSRVRPRFVSGVAHWPRGILVACGGITVPSPRDHYTSVTGRRPAQRLVGRRTIEEPWPQVASARLTREPDHLGVRDDRCAL
jgi:hypothetical protein